MVGRVDESSTEAKYGSRPRGHDRAAPRRKPNRPDGCQGPTDAVGGGANRRQIVSPAPDGRRAKAARITALDSTSHESERTLVRAKARWGTHKTQHRPRGDANLRRRGIRLDQTVTIGNKDRHRCTHSIAAAALGAGGPCAGSRSLNSAGRR